MALHYCIDIFLIAIALSMDSFAVAMPCGVFLKKEKFSKSLRLALVFGFFQGIMPIIGWLGSLVFRGVLQDYSKTISFILLLFIGLKMCSEAIKNEEEKSNFNPVKLTMLFSLGLATSVDAFAVGVTFSLQNMKILYPALVIGIVTFSLSLLGVFIGKRFGNFLGKKMEIFGGIILIVIALKIIF